MYSLKFSLLAFLCLFGVFQQSFAEVSSKNGNLEKAEFDINQLPFMERFMFLLTTHIAPKSFDGIPEKAFAEIQEYYVIPEIDNFFVDARQLFTQVSKLSGETKVPEFDWGYRYAFCIWWFCIDTEVRYSTFDSRFIGAENIKFSTQITPTTVSNTFEIPFFNWTSPGFLVNVTDHINLMHHYNKNSYYSIENMTIAFNCDYGFVPEIGIQLDNCSVYFDAGKVRGGLMEFERWDFNGNLLESYRNDPDEHPIEDYMMERWNYAKRDFTKGTQYSLNCFLSSGRSDEKCETDESLLQYYRCLNMQLIQTLGLGSLLN